MAFVQSVIRLLIALAITGLGSASVTPSELNKRLVCNSDNCLRALKAQPSSASAFCSTYTTSSATATTGVPSYIPTTCAPSRVSSACSCFVTPTATPTACPTGQVLTNPDFYDCIDDGYGGYDCDSRLEPWTITHLTSTTGCELIAHTYSYAYDMDPSSIGCQSPASGMRDQIKSELLTLCPGRNYTLVVHVGITVDKSSTTYPSFKVFLDDQVLLHSQSPCGSGQSLCQPHGDDRAKYREVTALVTGPANGKGTLIIEVSATGKTGDSPYDYLLLDTITLTPQ